LEEQNLCFAERELQFQLGVIGVHIKSGTVHPERNRGLAERRGREGGDKKLTAPEDRYIMTELATVVCPYFSVLRVEIDRQGVSYTIDTLRALRAMPEYAGAHFYFITGLDAVLDIVSWKNPEEIMTMCRFVAVSRYGYTHKKMEELPDRLRKKIIPLEIPLLAISSTELRERVRTGRSIRFMVPPTVEQFIRKKSLYRNHTEE